MPRLGPLLLAALVAGCAPRIGDGQLTCASNGGRCPSGFHCARDRTCWRDGRDPPTVGDKPDGTGCARGEECVSGVCAGTPGVCCDRACDGTCESCLSPGAVGVCTLLDGQPTGGRACAGDPGGACAGRCDGSSPDCVFPSTDVGCGGTCMARCDGAGTCPGGGGSCPGGLACGAGACLTRCASASDCQPNFSCATEGACLRDAESDCLDGSDNNGDGLADCADPSCAPSRVACVDAAEPGTLGQLAGGACALAYGGPPVKIYQGLTAPVCAGSGCACTVSAQCDYTFTFYDGSTDCTVGALLPRTVSLHAPAECSMVGGTATSLGGGTTRSVRIAASPPTAPGCQNVGATSAPPPAVWASSATFCPLSPTPAAAGCPGMMRCVPREACVLRPGANPCGGGFPAEGGAYHGGFTDTRSCACGACQPSGSCPTDLPQVRGYGNSDLTCQAANNTAVFTGLQAGACHAYKAASLIWGVDLASTFANLAGFTCSVAALTNGAATPSDPYTLCCP